MNLIKISRSYISNKNKTGLSKMHSYISIFGIMIGITALIVVNSAMQGFSNYLIGKINNDEEVSININENTTEKEKKELKDLILQNKETKRVLEIQKSTRENVTHIGNEKYFHYNIIDLNKNKDIVLDPDTIYFHESIKEIIVKEKIKEGMEKDKALALLEDYYVPVTIVENYEKIIDQSIFKVGFLKKVSRTKAYFSKETFEEHFTNNISYGDEYFQIELKDSIKSFEYKEEFSNHPHVSSVDHWLQFHTYFIETVKLEALLIRLVLFFIVLISVFNIVSTMTLIITEKKQDIYVLKTIGYSDTDILLVFLFTGLFYGLIGMFLGSCLGFLITINLGEIFSLIEWILNVNLLPITKEEIPYLLFLNDVLIINGVSLFLVLIASLLPSLKTLKITPAEGLKDE